MGRGNKIHQLRRLGDTAVPRANRRVTYEAPVNVDLPIDLVQEMDAFCDKTGMRKKQMVELALRRFLAAEMKSAPRGR